MIHRLRLKYLSWGVLLSMVAAFAITGCGGEKKENHPRKPGYQKLQSKEKPLVLIVGHDHDESSRVMSNQYEKALDYVKIPYRSIDLTEGDQSFEINSNLRLICITTTKVKQLSDPMVEELVRFVSKGNTLIFGQPVMQDRFAFLQGIKPASEYPINKEAQGYHFLSNILPGMKGRTLPNRGLPFHGGLKHTAFTDNIQTLVTAGNTKEYPVILRRRLGAGEVYVYNSSSFNDKAVRGMLFANVAEALEGVPYEVANVSTIFIDDFPAPLYNEKLQPIKDEYDMTHAEFVAKKFWPDMKALADTFGITYSAMTAFNYNANVVPPFDFNEWEHGRVTVGGDRVQGSVMLARDIAESRHELAFHGYNHFSLWVEDWPNKAFMVNSLEAAQKRWYVDDLGKLPATYVPPTDHIDSVGIQALTEGMPSLKYMCSLYLGDVEDGAGREFGPDPYSSKLFDYPRVTSGFYDSNSELFDQQNLYLLTGIWNHFIHPDDVFQLPGKKSEDDPYLSRNYLGLGWHHSKYGYGLYEEFRKRIVQTQKWYPLIRFESAREGVPVVQHWLHNRSTYNPVGNKMVVHRFKGDSQISRDSSLSYWFTFVPSAEKPRFAQWARDEGEQVAFTPFFDGYLMQMSARKDSIALPNLDPDLLYDPSYLAAQTSNSLSLYRQYQTRDNPLYAKRITHRWEDTRLKDALKAWRQKPSSRRLQDRLINMSVEFDSLGYALDILERRLLNHSPPWPSYDRDDLLKYYGWESSAQRAWTFTDSLWSRYPEEATIRFKDRVVDLFGTPDSSYTEKWMERRLKANPNDPEVLAGYIRRHQGQGDWPTVKPLLRRMLRQKPSNDTLYAYSFQRSLWYDPPSQSLQWLQEFPVDAEQQLKPFAADIARLYAYTGNNRQKALEWASKTDQVTAREQMQWMLDQRKYDDFRQRARQELQNHPNDDSLRIFVAQNLFDAGYYEQAYRTAYPIYDRGDTPPERLDQRIQQELYYADYNKRQELYERYPAIYSDSLKERTETRYRRTEGIRKTATGSYETDNFNNTVGRAGVSVEWGNRRKQTHHVQLEQLFVGSEIQNNQLHDLAQRLNYSYSRKSMNQRLQTTVGGGLLYAGSTPFPEATVQGAYATEKTFTSGQLRFGPVLTNTAIDQRYQVLHGTAYREDPLIKNKLRSGLSFEGQWYTNNVWQGAATERLFYDYSPLGGLHLRPTLEGSYLDATRKYQGTPYWTPDQLMIGGAGLNLQYRHPEVDPATQLEAEVMPKYDNRDGAYLTARTQLNTRLGSNWDLGVEASWSSSDVYRSNRYFVTLSYYLPKERDFNPPQDGLPQESALKDNSNQWHYSYEEAVRDYNSYERARKTPGLFTAGLKSRNHSRLNTKNWVIRIRGDEGRVDTLLAAGQDGRYRLQLMPGTYTAQPIRRYGGNTANSGEIHPFKIYPLEQGDLTSKVFEVSNRNIKARSGFALQFGAFESERSARQKAREIRGKCDLEIEVTRKDNGLYAVRTPVYSKRATADQKLDELQRQGGPLAFMDQIERPELARSAGQKSQWQIQLGAFRDIEHAVRRAQVLQLRYGYSPAIMQSRDDSLYRLMTGRLSKSSEAKQYISSIQDLPGFEDAFVRRIEHPEAWSRVVLDADPVRFHARGKVSGRLQVEVEGALITLGNTPVMIEQLGGSYRRTLLTAADGSFEVENLPEGSYTVYPLNHKPEAYKLAHKGKTRGTNKTHPLNLVWKAKKEDEREMRALKWAGPDLDKLLKPHQQPARYSVQLNAFQSPARARAYATAMAHQLHRKTLVYKDLDTGLFNVSLERTMDRLEAYQWKNHLKRREGLGDVFVTAI